MSAVQATAHLSSRPSRAPEAPLPFPFLTLCWRIGLAGQWVRPSGGRAKGDLLTPTLAADPSAMAGNTCRQARRLYRVGMARLLACRDEARTHLRFSMRGPWPGEVLNDSPPVGDPLWRCLQRSHLAQRISATDRSAAERAAIATFRVLVAAPAPPRTQSFPPLWRPLAAAVVPGPGRAYLPFPRARYDPLTWSLLGRLLDQWEGEGLTFLGRERRQFYLRFGTRRMARTYAVSRRRALACGRAAYRIWRHWYETREEPRQHRLRELPLPPAVYRSVGDPTGVYRAIRHARRVRRPNPYAGLLPTSFTALLLEEADRSIASFPRQPTTAEWPSDPLSPLARAFEMSPLAAAGRGVGLRETEIRRLTTALAAALLKVLTAPWPWGKPR